MKLKLLFLLLVLVTFSCTDTKKDNETKKVADKQQINKEEKLFSWKDFGTVQNVNMKKLFSIYAGNAKIKAIDSLLLFNDDKHQYLFLVTNQKGDTIQNLFRKGKGPDELSAINTFDFFMDSLIFIYDGFSNHKVLIFKTHDILFNKKPKALKSIKIGNNPYIIYGMINMNKILAVSLTAKDKFIIIDSSSHVFEKIGEFAFLNNKNVDEIHSIYLNTFYYRSVNKNPQNDKYVLTFMSTDVIEIYDSNGNQIFVGHGPDGIVPEGFKKEFLSGPDYYQVPFDSSIVYTYHSIQTNENNFFVSYKGKTLNDEPLGMHYILEFDWKGKPVKAFYVDKPFNYYYIDFKNKYLYTYNYNEEAVYKARFN